jgi:hypothetical protein
MHLLPVSSAAWQQVHGRFALGRPVGVTAG